MPKTTKRGYKIPDPQDLEKGRKDLEDNLVQQDAEMTKLETRLRRAKLNSLLGKNIFII